MQVVKYQREEEKRSLVKEIEALESKIKQMEEKENGTKTMVTKNRL